MRIDYDKEHEILWILVAEENSPCVGYDLSDKVVAHRDENTNELVSLTIFDIDLDTIKRFLFQLLEEL
ncbi:MAG: hypothetical protein WC476_00790 [Phycisphaerae bacterium]|jgi:uncharacterized protein YuzE